MKHLSRSLITTLSLATLAGTAAAQDAEPAPASDAPAEAAPAEAMPVSEPTGGAAMEPAKKITVGADLLFVLPLGDYAGQNDVTFVTFALGGLVRGEYALNSELSITGRLGYVYNSVDFDGVSLSFIPVLAGASYKIGTSGLSAYGELGINYITQKVDVAGLSDSTSELKLSAGAGVGYQMDKIKGRLGLWMPGSNDDSNGDSTTLFGITASVGYDFASF